MAILEENDILFAHKALNIMAGLTEATRRVAGAIIDHFNKRTGQCDPSIERLASLLGVARATVIRATDLLHERGIIEKVSHGGKAHRAAYLPNWDRFHITVEDWDERMKTGKTRKNRNDACEMQMHSTCTAPAKVASVRRSRSQDCDVKGRSAATQTLRSNQSKKPVEENHTETSNSKPQVQSVQQPSQGLWKGNKPQAQRSMLLPINGGQGVSHAQAAQAAAARRLYGDIHRLGERAEAEVLEWLNDERVDVATDAEKHRKGGGMAFIIAEMHGAQMRA